MSCFPWMNRKHLYSMVEHARNCKEGTRKSNEDLTASCLFQLWDHTGGSALQLRHHPCRPTPPIKQSPPPNTLRKVCLAPITSQFRLLIFIFYSFPTFSTLFALHKYNTSYSYCFLMLLHPFQPLTDSTRNKMDFAICAIEEKMNRNY